MTIDPCEVDFITHDRNLDIIVVTLTNGIEVMFPKRICAPYFIINHCTHYDPDAIRYDGSVTWHFRR